MLPVRRTIELGFVSADCYGIHKERRWSTAITRAEWTRGVQRLPWTTVESKTARWTSAGMMITSMEEERESEVNPGAEARGWVRAAEAAKSVRIDHVVLQVNNLSMDLWICFC
ncbi:hypothetical protein Mp_6g20130 [Marchantia polymorpha subsp. ruderalis]|uniref:Uncharacterized protein n=2 Tax=Marchantia polymorpha TaxID=3197 RepID=A0AAF6BU23_MARPO|nr:hypothetical protein MARPO_0045s0051 [Marchantia polymorpha]BBN15507.1 hypothetical protein Mp_6g20130 [Marchantia polymorpha subsp. ruderalis]|eukprot:PTQ39382.1 hypothetical protein MARPO_0045s0051 [Marchantia polymorpha]